MRKGTIHLATGFLLIGILQAQDIRLLDITTIYIVPSDDEKEVRQFEEKLPKEIGWEIVYDKSKADAFLVYRSGGSMWGPFPTKQKVVEIYTTTEPPELLWVTQRKGTLKIAGTAVDRLKKAIRKLKNSALDSPDTS